MGDYIDNSDKFDKEDSDNEQEVKDMEKNNILHGKPGDVAAKLNFVDTESDSSDRDDTDHLCTHPNFYDDVASFDKKTV